RAVTRAQRAEGRDRSGHGVRDFGIVPDGAATSRPAHDVDAAPLDRRAIVALQRGLVASERETGRGPAVQTQESVARAIRFLEQRLIDVHVFGARTSI